MLCPGGHLPSLPLPFPIPFNSSAACSPLRITAHSIDFLRSENTRPQELDPNFRPALSKLPSPWTLQFVQLVLTATCMSASCLEIPAVLSTCSLIPPRDALVSGRSQCPCLKLHLQRDPRNSSCSNRFLKITSLPSLCRLSHLVL